jgi:PAS domain S-box-containing protein
MDITERKQTEYALQREKEFSENIIQSSFDGILAFDRDCRYTVWNRGLEGLTGVSSAVTIGQRAFDIFPFLQETGEDRYFYDALDGKSVLSTNRKYVIPQTGRQGYFEGYYSPLRNESGEIIGGLVIIREITERVQAEKSLRESEARYRSLFNDSPISLWEEDYTALFIYLGELRDRGVTDFRDYFENRPQEVAHSASLIKVIDVNKATLDLYKAGSKEELANNLHKIIADESYLAFKDELIALTDGQTKFSTEVPNLTLDGDTIDVNVNVSVVPSSEETQKKVLLSITDITERKRAEKEIQNHLTRLEAIREIELSILAAQSPGDTAMTALERIQVLLPYNFGGVVLYDFDANQVEFLATYPVGEDDDPLITRSYTIDEFTPYLDTLRSGQIYIMPDLAAETDLSLASELLKDSGIRSFIDVPLIVRGDLIGSFNVLSDQPNAFETVHLDIAREVANALAVSIQQGRLLETEQRRREELETLEQVSMSLRQADSREELFSILLTETRALFNADSGAILTPCKNKFEYTIVQGPQDIETFLTQQKFADAELVEIINAEDPVFLPDLPFDKIGVVSATLLPIQFNRQTFGAMILHWFERGDFPTEERHMLNTIADMAGIALERMHILENLEFQVTDRTLELTTLYELTALLAAESDLTDTLHQTLERLLDTINSFSGTIHLMDDEHNQLDLVTHQGIDTDTESSLKTIRPDHILWKQLAEKGEPLLLMNIDKKDLITAGIQNLEIENYIGAPIQTGNMTIGIISAFYTSDHDPSLDEISLLNLVADQVGIAVERTHLREQAEQAAIMTERQRLARELHDAVTQSLYSISFLAKASQNFAHSGELEQVEQYLGTLQDTAQQALKEMRLLIYELLPTSLEQQGLASVLRHRLESVEQRAGIEVEFLTTGSFDLPTEVQFDIYRIAQEAINNTLKHASATTVKVHLVGSEHGLEMTIEDNGTGFDPQETSGGMGLDSMNNRADKLGGKLTITSDPGQGTLVKLTIDEVMS